MSTQQAKIPSREELYKVLNDVPFTVYLGDDYEEDGRIYAPFAGKFAVAELAGMCKARKIDTIIGCSSKKEGVPHLKVVGRR